MQVLPAPPRFNWVQKLLDWRLEAENQLKLVAQCADGQIAALTVAHSTPRAWRVSFAPDGQAPPALPIVTAPIALPLRIARGPAGGLTVHGAETQLHVQAEPWCLAWQTAAGRPLCRENPADADGLNRRFVLPLGFVRDEQGQVARITQSFYLDPDEHLWGLGEKFTRLDKVGQRVTAWTLDALGAASERAYKNVPLLISSRGYALFLNTGARCTFDLGTESCESYTLSVEAPALDLFVLCGDTPAELLAAYTELTGRAPVPPKWTFGLWLSGSGSHRDEAAIRRLAAGVDEHDLPCDVIHIDPWWMRWRKYADFRWDRQAYPDVAGLIAELQARKLHLSLWQHPYISVESELYAEGQALGYFVRRPDGSVYVIDYGLSLSTLPGGVTQIAAAGAAWNAPVAIIDLTNPAAKAWYQALMRPVLAQGADVFKTDFGEDIPADARFANGLTGAEMHNLYPLYYNQAVFEVTQQVKGQGVVWARSAWAGSQRYPVCWSGDPACTWASLAFTLRGGLSLGLSGVPFWSHDIGGYRGHPTEALYIRWAQFGLLSSHARCHGESEREPWHFGERALAIFRRYARLRYQLFPYLYACAHEASRSGLPVLRAMPLAFPADPNVYDKDLQYMLGPHLLVAPIYRADGRRSIYFPAGEWLDYWTGETVVGPRTLHVAVPLETLPLYVRRGAVLPLMPPANRIPDDWIDPLLLEIYPAEVFAYRLWEDEGATEFQGSAGPAGLRVAWRGPAERAVRLRLYLDRDPARASAQLTPGGRADLPWRRVDTRRVAVEIPRCRAAEIDLTF